MLFPVFQQTALQNTRRYTTVYITYHHFQFCLTSPFFPDLLHAVPPKENLWG